MNHPNYQRATILVAGREFATGSSREFAVWGLKDWGFNVVIAPSFGDIFYKNAIINDLLPIILPEAEIETLWTLLLKDHYSEIAIDLESERVSIKDYRWPLSIEPIAKRRYLENLNEITESMALIPLIEQYELETAK